VPKSSYTLANLVWKAVSSFAPQNCLTYLPWTPWAKVYNGHK
jgi:hypothetical protein